LVVVQQWDLTEGPSCRDWNRERIVSCPRWNANSSAKWLYGTVQVQSTTHIDTLSWQNSN